MSKVHNFSAGPGILPLEVLKQSAEACINFDNMNLSLLEISHRSKNYVAVMDEARALVKELFEVGDEYEVLFLGGGASMQFAMVPYNLLTDKGYAAYLNTGVWASKAIKESKIIGNTKVIASSEDKNFNYIPKGYEVPKDADYFHITSNNTIYGTQLKSFPKCEVPLVCDMSSDLFSRKVNAKDFALIYAGAQKNMGAAGVNLLVIKKSLLGTIKRPISPIMDYQKHIDANSLLNTPPVFAVYVAMLTLRWIKQEGGLTVMEKRAEEKANLLYSTIDSLPLFECYVEKESRSKMNAVFFIKDEALQNEFLNECKANNMVGVKGYRTVGGIRVSMYNALAMESVKAFCDLAKDFNNRKG